MYTAISSTRTELFLQAPSNCMVLTNSEVFCCPNLVCFYIILKFLLPLMKLSLLWSVCSKIVNPKLSFLYFWPERKISSGYMWSILFRVKGWKKLFAWWTATFYWPSVKMNFASYFKCYCIFYKVIYYYSYYWFNFIQGEYICDHWLGFLHIIFYSVLTICPF